MPMPDVLVVCMVHNATVVVWGGGAGGGGGSARIGYGKA